MAAGGYHELGKKLGATIWAISKWKERGIPQEYWEQIEKHYGVSLAELYHITKKTKKQNAA